MSGDGESRGLPAGLRRAYVLALAPSAFLAPIPLYFTGGASLKAIAVYELGLAMLWARARAGRTVRMSNGFLNVAGLGYLILLGFEIAVLRHGLLLCVSHLLLFTALAKIASLRSAGEARTALLVLFLLSLAAASSSTHVSSLLYFAAMAVVGFRALARLAVLADFDAAPPERVLRSVPTTAVSAAGLAGAALLALPLFYGLPRLKGPYAVAPFRLGDNLSTALSSDRVDLEAFGAAKRSDRIVLRLTADRADWKRVVRLREASFTQYRDGEWTRRASPGRPTAWPDRPAAPGPRGEPVRIDLNLFAKGFLFLPYGVQTLRLEEGRSALTLSDGVVQASAGRRAVRYEAGLGPVAPARGPGESAIEPGIVPRPVREYADKLLGDERDPAAEWEKIRAHLAKNFVYTLEPPEPRGDPIVDFLTRHRAGHCEYFASATALMLAARGIRARLVTGSYGGEVGLFSSAIVVRGENLHAWVEADLDGSGFSVIDPTPPAGVPAAESRGSFWRQLASFGREVEFFYDRRILGFESLDQQQFFETARERVQGIAGAASSGWRDVVDAPAARIGAGGVIGLAAAAIVLRDLLRRRKRLGPATRAYVAARGLLARRVGFVSPATPPAEVARRLATLLPDGAEDAQAIVSAYTASAFGGRTVDRQTEEELRRRVRRLRKLA
ncbi:MAG TPA: transglutaminaseTgpA domain-containing protein [Thermoanaerobaculia bacterium]|jgi:transglutaminase-like putative cysteine protease